MARMKSFLDTGSTTHFDLWWWLHNFPDLLHTCASLIARLNNKEVWRDTTGLVGWEVTAPGAANNKALG